jgi:hypothetical protein
MIICINSCKKETTWDIDASIPIAKSRLNISNFFAEDIFDSDDTGLVHVSFKKEILNLSLDSLVKVPDTTLLFNYISPFNSSLNPGDVIYSNASAASIDKEIIFNLPNDIQLNKLIVRSGILKIKIKNTYSQPINFVYEINSAKLSGKILHIEQVINSAASSTKPTETVKYYSLTGYEIDLKGISGNKENTLVQTYTIKTDASGQSDVLSFGKGLYVELSLLNIIPDYVQGYFGQQDFTFGPDSSYFGQFNNFSSNNFKLTQSKINFSIENGFGLEMSSNVSQINSIKVSPYQAINLNTGTLLKSLNINRAVKTNVASKPVFPYIKQISLNSSNTNLNQFIENIPNYLGYTLNAKLNPLGNISGGNDFAYYGYGLKVIADVDIPLVFSADYFKLIYFANVDLAKVKEINNVNSCDLILHVKNNFPLDMKIQGYMIDENNSVIDSLFLFNDNLIPKALTNAANIVLRPIESKILSSLSGNKLANFKRCKQIKLVSNVYLPNQPTPVKITSDNYLDLILSTNVNYTAKI